MRYVVLAVVAMLFGACTHEAKPARYVVVEVEGKRFAVPQGAIVSDRLATDREIAFFTQSGAKGCRKGSVIWEMPDVQGRIGEAIAKGDATVHADLAKEGKIGCASPL